MINSTIYIATQDVAERTGFISSRYRTKDGRFILNHQDLRRVSLTTDEVLNGLGDKVQVIDKEVANDLIIENGFALGAKPIQNEGNNQMHQTSTLNNEQEAEQEEQENKVTEEELTQEEGKESIEETEQQENESLANEEVEEVQKETQKEATSEESEEQEEEN